MTEKRIFCFWEPAGTMPGYLELCMQTWRKTLPDYDVVLLDRSSIGTYIGDVYDLDLLSLYPLPQQKDALMMALLHRHGGIFLDIDTVAVSDIAPLVNELEHASLVILWRYFAFMAARPDSLILERCVAGVRHRLEDTGTPGPQMARRWGYLGNEVWAEVLEEMTGNIGRVQQVVVGAATSLAGLARPQWRKKLLRYRIETGADRFSVWRWRVLLQWFHAGELTMLDRDAHGYLPERLRFPRAPVLAREKYQTFWFESEGADMDDVFLPNQPLIALHGSWTPKWYRELSAAAVLDHPCLLSRTLKKLVG